MSASASVTVTAINPAVLLIVDVDLERVYAGEEVVFTYIVRNIGDADLDNVTVEDSVSSAIDPVNLAVGSPSMSWNVRRRIWVTTTNDVTATGTEPLGGTVSDSESVTVGVVESVESLDPIDIQEPLVEGQTAVTGTAEAGRTVYIRDVMSDTFPSLDTVVDAGGAFEFAGLPSLVAGHVIVVEGYGESDSAVVGAIAETVEPIAISALCHGDNVVAGTAEPHRPVELFIPALSYQDSTTVDANGDYAFTLAGGLALQTGQTVEVSGYGDSASAVVDACTTDAYITISPQCADLGSDIEIIVNGYNWQYIGVSDPISIQWDDDPPAVRDLGKPDEWQTTITITATEGSHEVSAWNNKTPLVLATFLSPCPAANLVINDLTLLTTEPISTHQPLDFRVTVENAGLTPINRLFWVDLYMTEPMTDSFVWAAVSGLAAGTSVPLTITAQSGLPTTGTYQVFALVDSQNQVAETDEGDNEAGPATVDVTQAGSPSTSPVTGTGSIEGETWINLTGTPVVYGRTDVRVYWGNSLDDAELVATILSDDEGVYAVSGLAAGSYIVQGETWIDSTRYSRTYYNVTVNDDESTTLIIVMYEG